MLLEFFERNVERAADLELEAVQPVVGFAVRRELVVDDQVGRVLGDLYVLFIHGLNGTYVLQKYSFKILAGLADIAHQTAQEFSVQVRLDEYRIIEKVG